MRAPPPQWAELIVGWLIPPSARESVLGDLRERHRVEHTIYAFDCARTIPLVALSSMRRTSDPQVLLGELLGLYLVWLLVAWVLDRPYLEREWSLLKLSAPAFAAVWAMLASDAWSRDGKRRTPVVRAVIGTLAALLSLIQGLLPWRIVLPGLGYSLLAAAVVGWIAPIFPGAPLLWEDHVIRVTECVVILVTIGAVCAFLASWAALFARL